MKPEQKRQIFKWIVFVVYILFLFLLQQTPGVFPAILNVRPIFLISAVICAAMFEGEGAGCVLAVLAGLLWDVSRIRPFGYSAVILVVFACLCGLLVTFIMRRNILTAFLYCFAGLAVYELIDWLIFFLPSSNGDAVQALYRIILPRMVYSLLFVPLFYWIQSKLSAKFYVQSQ